MFTAWVAPVSRPTREIGLLAGMENAVEAVVAIMRELSAQAAGPNLTRATEVVAGLLDAPDVARMLLFQAPMAFWHDGRCRRSLRTGVVTESMA
jgi:hypothetical protein